MELFDAPLLVVPALTTCASCSNHVNAVIRLFSKDFAVVTALPEGKGKDVVEHVCIDGFSTTAANEFKHTFNIYSLYLQQKFGGAGIPPNFLFYRHLLKASEIFNPED